jgi:hypothetical protein
MVGFIAVLEQTSQLQQFWCANSKKNPNIDREIKYLDFFSGHLASAETQGPKKSQVTKLIRVAFTKHFSSLSAMDGRDHPLKN